MAPYNVRARTLETVSQLVSHLLGILVVPVK